ncbi:polyprenyl synthetase family protein [Candidatus Pacearchaeota archaeon]|nr:polyprenyl synthetase family protein [Candidatus Pacearchaeota archaeon]
METRTKVNGGELYGEIMRNISPKVNEYIQDKITSLGLSSELEELVLELPKKREGKNIMRSTMSFLIYKNLGGDYDISRILPLLALSELSNYYAYLDNWILDNKGGVLEDNKRIKDITIASEIIREVIQKCLEEFDIVDDKKREISKRLAESSISCYHGQFTDLNVLNVSRAGELTEDEFILRYAHRSKLLSGELYGFSAEIAAIAADTSEKQIEQAKKFGSIFGTGLQMSNDLGDFALFLGKENSVSFKHYRDQLADITNGRLTLPIFYTLRYGSEKDKEPLTSLIGNINATIEEKKAASLAILSSGAFNKTRSILKKYHKELKGRVKTFEDNEYRAALSSMIETIIRNKYIEDLKEIGGKNGTCH